MSECCAAARLSRVPRVVRALSAALRPASGGYVARVDGRPQVPRQGICRPLHACGRLCGLPAAAGLPLGASRALLSLVAAGLWQHCWLARILLAQELEQRPGAGTGPCQDSQQYESLRGTLRWGLLAGNGQAPRTSVPA